MKIHIKDVGIISNTSIDCDGVTIITGKNGSGKTTFAKSLTSVISGSRFSMSNFLSDCVYYVQNKLQPFYYELLFLTRRPFYFTGGRTMKEHAIERISVPAIERIAYQSLNIDSIDELLNCLLSAREELLNNKESFAKKYESDKDILSGLRDPSILFDKCLSETNEVIAYIGKGVDVKKYIYETIKDELNYAFHGQISPVGFNESDPAIIIQDTNEYFEYYHNSFSNSKISTLSFVNKAFYISNGDLLDQIDSRKRKSKPSKGGSGVKPSLLSLEDELLYAISFKPNIVSFEAVKNHYPEIFEIINSVWPHDVIKQKGITINADSGLNISNEASGSKIFIMLKLMLLNGFIDKNTLLVFDEPENHLHPEWQTNFAKLILLINKQIGSKIICVTHSQTLLLAFDVFSKKIKRDDFKVYFGEQKQGRSTFCDYSSNTQMAHKKLTDPYVFMGHELLFKK